MYGWLLRPLLFLLPPELAHELVMACLSLISKLPFALHVLHALRAPKDPCLRVEALGLCFPSPVGLAAGLDKNAKAFDALLALGFGFVEVGTLTPKPQPGNPRPRLFRLPRDRALINRMGFNNCGADEAAERLARRGERGVVGANVGRNKLTSNDAAVADYVTAARRTAPFVDYMVVNVSSPNTPSLRALQAVEQLRPLLTAAKSALAAIPGRRVPLFVKISPDSSDDQIDAIADLVLELGIEGIIATNTTVSRAELCTPAAEVERCGDGGLSGAPLKRRSLEVLERLRRRVGTKVVIVSVGGIDTADDAWQRIRAGATLVQVYTSFVYDGPGLIGRLNAGLAERVRASGYRTVLDAVGSATTIESVPVTQSTAS